MSKKKELSEKAKEKRREYMAKWRKKNPEKVKKHQKDYWERQALKDEAEKEA